MYFHIAVLEKIDLELRSRVLCGDAEAQFAVYANHAAKLPEDDFCPDCKAELDKLNGNHPSALYTPSHQ